MSWGAGPWGSGGSGSTDVTEPTIFRSGSLTVTRRGVASISVTDEGGLSAVVVLVTLGDLRSGVAVYRSEPEVVWDGTAFRGRYRGSSERTAITDGFRWDLVRDGGWPAVWKIEVLAVDSAGNIGIIP